MFKKGEKVIGRAYEFENVKGEVIGMINNTLVIVNFESSEIPVITIVDNLKIIR